MSRVEEKELHIDGGTIRYTVQNDQIHIVSCRTAFHKIQFPAEIENRPVTVLLKKALLGNKRLQSIQLPVTVREIQDWAFAHCDRLEIVSGLSDQVMFRRGVFKDCKKLQKIELAGKGLGEEANDKLSGLLAMTPVKMDAEYLLNPLEAGGREWFQKLDARMKLLLEQPEEEGYMKQVLCGEEDLMSSLEVYLEERHRAKTELCYLRLLYDLELSEEFKEKLQGYLLEHTAGCEYPSAWNLILKEHGQELIFYELFAQAGCITDENFEELLLDMGDSYPEMKAWLIRRREKKQGQTDFFDGLSLDGLF